MRRHYCRRWDPGNLCLSMYWLFSSRASWRELWVGYEEVEKYVAGVAGLSFHQS